MHVPDGSSQLLVRGVVDVVVQDNQGTHAGIPLTIQQAGSLCRGEERGGEGREQKGGEERRGSRGEERRGSRGEERRGSRGEERRGEGVEERRGEEREQRRGEERRGSRGEGAEEMGGEGREQRRGEEREQMLAEKANQGLKDTQAYVHTYSKYTYMHIRTYVRKYTSAIEKVQWMTMQWIMHRN